MKRPYSTSMASCGLKTCPEAEQKLSSQYYECAYPYVGALYVSGPFSNLTKATVFHTLEMSMWTKLILAPGSVSLEDLFFKTDDYLEMHLALFPSQGVYFNRTEVQRISFDLSNQTYKPPAGYGFGPYYFIADPYIFAVQEPELEVHAPPWLEAPSGCLFGYTKIGAIREHIEWAFHQIGTFVGSWYCSKMSQGLWEVSLRSKTYTYELLGLIDRLQPDFAAPSGESLRQVEFWMVQFLN